MGLINLFSNFVYDCGEWGTQIINIKVAIISLYGSASILSRELIR